MLLSEQSKLVNQIEWSGSLSGAPSPSGFGLDLSARCFSKRGTGIRVEMEMKRLKEDVLRLQSQCMFMEKQIEKLAEKKRSGSYFSWKKITIPTFKGTSSKFERNSEAGFGPKSPVKIIRGRTPNRRRSSS